MHAGAPRADPKLFCFIFTLFAFSALQGRMSQPTGCLKSSPKNKTLVNKRGHPVSAENSYIL